MPCPLYDLLSQAGSSKRRKEKEEKRLNQKAYVEEKQLRKNRKKTHRQLVQSKLQEGEVHSYEPSS